MSENFEVPIIDIAPFLNGDLQDRVAVAKEIDTALSSVGCIYVNGHGIAQSQVDEAISWVSDCSSFHAVNVFCAFRLSFPEGKRKGKGKEKKPEVLICGLDSL